MAGVYGMQTKLGIDTVNPVTARFDFVSESLVKDEGIINANGLRGTLSHHVNRVRKGIQPITGTIGMNPTAAEWALLMPWVTDGTPTGSPVVTYPLGDTATTRFVTIDRLSKVFTYASVGVDVLRVQGRRNEPITAELDLVATTETVANAGTFPAINIIEGTHPFVFHDLVLSVNAVTVRPSEMTFTLNKMIDKDRFLNSQTLVTVQSQDREVMLNTKLPYGDYFALYDAGAPDGGVAAVATFTYAGTVMTFTFPAIVFPAKSPQIPGREEIFFDVDARAYRTDASAEVVITIDSTP
jgi:hypothetical protein